MATFPSTTAAYKLYSAFLMSTTEVDVIPFAFLTAKIASISDFTPQSK